MQGADRGQDLKPGMSSDFRQERKGREKGREEGKREQDPLIPLE